MKTNLFVFILLLISTIHAGAITGRELTERIISHIVKTPYTETIDVFKEGNPDDEVTGIAVCMFATMDVLKQAVKNNCNFILTHEPIYYNHQDAIDKFTGDSVVLAKKKFINEHHLMVWRFHDYLHSIQPDLVTLGMAEKLGWKSYATDNTFLRYKIPEATLQEVLDHLKTCIPLTSFNVVGNLKNKVSSVCFAPGASGSDSHIQAYEKEKPQLIIAGEVQQWETYEYVRDAVQQGRNMAVVFLGHIPSEDQGMEITPRWLKTFVTEVPIKFFECGPSYITY